LFAAATRPRAVTLFPYTTLFRSVHETAYGAAVTSAPRLTPSSLNCTPTTPMLSVALAETVTVPATVTPAAGAVMETVGGVVSGGAAVLNATSADVAGLAGGSRDF